MQFVRPLGATHPCSFGRARARIVAVPASFPWRLSDDARLFATTFVLGFVFVLILIG